MRNGLASRKAEDSASRLFESTLHFSGEIASNLNISALGGYSCQDFTNEGFSAEGGDFLTDDFSFNNLSAALDFKNGKGTITSFKSSNRLSAFFGRINLIIKNIWFVTASARYEGSSRFGANNKWGLFPAAGAGMDVAKVLNIKFINNLKLRLNYGITGNQPGESYLSLLRLSSLSPQWYSWYDGNFYPEYSVVNNANPDLKWEKKGEFDAGFDFSIFKNKLSGSFDFYTSKTKDLLQQYFVPVPPNLYNLEWMNNGEIRSSGLELTLNYKVIDKTDFSYRITLTHSRNFRNTLVLPLYLYYGTSLVTYNTEVIGDIGSPGHGGEPLILLEEGKPIGQLIGYVFNGIDQNGRIILADINHDGSINGLDRTIIGHGLPKSMMGFDNVFNYKNWDLNIFFRGVFGHDLLNSYRSFYEVPNYIEYYNLPETATNMRNNTTGELATITSGILTSKDVENASFISLDNITLGYSFRLPVSSQFSSIRIFLGGNNLFYLTGYKGPDPNPRYVDSEPDLGTYNSPLVPGVDRRNTWPRTRSVTFGVNVVL